MTLRRSTRDIDLGFGNYNEQIDYNHPKVQILTSKPMLPPERRIYYCSKCNGSLQWLQQNSKYICYQCSVTYSELDSHPLSSISNSIKPLQSTDPYESIEPAIVSKKIDRRLQGERTNKHIQVTGDMRRARVHVNGSPAMATEDAIRKELGDDAIYGY